MRHTAADKNPIQYIQRRSQRIAALRNFRWIQANVLSTFHRSPRSARGRPLGFPRDFQIRRGICGWIPRLRIFFSQVSRVVSLVHLCNSGPFSRPSLFPSSRFHPIQQWQDLISLACRCASMYQRQWHSVPVRKRMNRYTLPLESILHALAASLSGCEGTVDAGSFPGNLSGKFGQSENALYQIQPCSISLPFPKPPMRGGSLSPRGSFRHIGPATTSNQNPEDRVQDLPETRRWFPTSPLGRRLWEKL